MFRSLAIMKSGLEHIKNKRITTRNTMHSRVYFRHLRRSDSPVTYSTLCNYTITYFVTIDHNVTYY
jgi:hypothetical protein